MSNRIMAEINIERRPKSNAFRAIEAKAGARSGARPRINTKRNEIEIDPGEHGIEIALAIDPHAKPPRRESACKNGECQRISAPNEVRAGHLVRGGSGSG